ncbi:MAG: pyruvate ferredoxin oxidoreductase, partial [bacterium]|nr:pyruvate ferredoxin oxidoreductase [bacterium]
MNTMVTLKELSKKEDLFVSGHGLCRGCGIPSILKIVLRASKYPVVVFTSTGCLQVASTNFPWNSWKLNWIHSVFENAASTMSGVERMYRVLKKKGKYALGEDVRFLVIAGDGATYDAGFASLSGAVERGHNFVYLCCDNQMYAGSGGQHSSATPMGASTSTTPAGEFLPGKMQARKNMTKIMAAHQLPYVAQSAPWIWQDLYKKAERAFETAGAAFLNILSPCPNEWKTPTAKTIELSRLAADTCVWPVYEVKHGSRVTINYKPGKQLAVTQW